MRRSLPLALVAALTLCSGRASAQSPTSDGGRPTPTAVTLDELLEHAGARAPARVRAVADVSLGAAAVVGARPWLPDNPRVYVGLGSRMNPYGLHAEVQAQLTQRLEIAGERGMRRRAAVAQRSSLERQAIAVQWDVEVGVRAAFARAVIARELLDARRRVESFNRRTTELVRTRLAAGDVAELQLRVAQGELALAEQARIAAETEYEVACRRLAAAAGWAEDVAIEPRGALAKLAPLPSIDALLDELDDHPRVAALDAAVESAEARVASERRERWPEPSLGVYAAREHEPGTPVVSRVVLATIELPLPLFQRNQAGLARARAELRVARAAQATRRYELGQEIRRWRVAADGAALRVRSYADEVLPRFAENLEQLGKAFELGEIGGLEVVLARQRFADMQMEALAAWRDYVDAAEGLERAAGRPVAPAIDLGGS